MKPFDLQKAIDGHPLVTRDGRTVTDFTYFENARFDNCRCRCVIDGHIYGFAANGRYVGKQDTEYDLFLAPKERITWVNVCTVKDNGCNRVYARTWDSEEDAKRYKANLPKDTKCVVITSITWKE